MVVTSRIRSQRVKPKKESYLFTSRLGIHELTGSDSKRKCESRLVSEESNRDIVLNRDERQDGGS